MRVRLAKWLRMLADRLHPAGRNTVHVSISADAEPFQRTLRDLESKTRQLGR